MKKINLAVIFGGQSGEHEVSLKSAGQVMKALNRDRYEIIPIAITRKGVWLIGEDGREYLESSLGNGMRKDEVKNGGNIFSGELPDVDLALPIVHGTYVEDGRLQGMLEMLNIPYVFSNVLSSALAMNKEKTKIIAKNSGIKIAKDAILRKDGKYDFEKIIKKLGFPVVIKPLELGSSVGTSIANSMDELERGVDDALKYGEEVLLEQFVKGRELTVTVMGTKKPKALPVIEIIPKISSWFDYQAKYETGGSEEICPAKIPEDIRKKVQKQAVKIFKTLGCRDLARADFIWSEIDRRLYFLEINTIPGMTGTSLAPQAAKAAGMNFSEFLDKIIKNSRR